MAATGVSDAVAGSTESKGHTDVMTGNTQHLNTDGDSVTDLVRRSSKKVRAEGGGAIPHSNEDDEIQDSEDHDSEVSSQSESEKLTEVANPNTNSYQHPETENFAMVFNELRVKRMMNNDGDIYQVKDNQSKETKKFDAKSQGSKSIFTTQENIITCETDTKSKDTKRCDTTDQGSDNRVTTQGGITPRETNTKAKDTKRCDTTDQGSDNIVTTQGSITPRETDNKAKDTKRCDTTDQGSDNIVTTQGGITPRETDNKAKDTKRYDTTDQGSDNIVTTQGGITPRETNTKAKDTKRCDTTDQGSDNIITTQGGITPRETNTKAKDTKRCDTTDQGSDNIITTQGSITPRETDTKTKDTKRCDTTDQGSDNIITTQGGITPRETNTKTKDTKRCDTTDQGSDNIITTQGGITPRETDTKTKDTKRCDTTDQGSDNIITTQGGITPRETNTKAKDTKRCDTTDQGSDNIITTQGSITPRETNTKAKDTKRCDTTDQGSDNIITTQGSITPRETNTEAKDTKRCDTTDQGSDNIVTTQGSITPRETDTKTKDTKRCDTTDQGSDNDTNYEGQSRTPNLSQQSESFTDTPEQEAITILSSELCSSEIFHPETLNETDVGITDNHGSLCVSIRGCLPVEYVSNVFRGLDGSSTMVAMCQKGQTDETANVEHGDSTDTSVRDLARYLQTSGTPPEFTYIYLMDMPKAGGEGLEKTCTVDAFLAILLLHWQCSSSFRHYISDLISQELDTIRETLPADTKTENYERMCECYKEIQHIFRYMISGQFTQAKRLVCPQSNMFGTFRKMAIKFLDPIFYHLLGATCSSCRTDESPIEPIGRPSADVTARKSDVTEARLSGHRFIQIVIDRYLRYNSELGHRQSDGKRCTGTRVVQRKFPVMPAFLPVNLEDVTIREREIDKKIEMNRERYQLAGIVYNRDEHFTARVCVPDTDVWFRYFGDNSGRLHPDTRMESGTRICYALYLIMLTRS